MRFESWRQQLRNSFGDVVVNTPTQEEFVVWSELWSAGGFAVCRLRVGAQRIELSAGQAGRRYSAAVHAVFPLSGEFHVEQAGRTVVVGPTDWTLYDPSMGFLSVSDRPVEMLVLAGPRAAMLGHGITLDRYITRRYSSENGSARMAKDYLASLMQEFAGIHPLTRGDLAMLAAQLVRLTLAEHAGSGSRLNARDLLRARIETYVSCNLRDPELSIDAVARAHNCSKRYLQKLFHSEPLSQYIRRLRLERCFHDLSNQELCHLSVTEIAFSWGFQHQGHFSRIFRKHFNLPPSRCRPTPEQIHHSQ